MNKFKVEDNGDRQTYETGMMREPNHGRIRYDLCDMPMLKRWAELMTKGAEKYSEHNWKKASTQEELDRFVESAFRHFFQWITGERDEDHAAAVIFNLAGAEHVMKKLLDKNDGYFLLGVWQEIKKLHEEPFTTKETVLVQNIRILSNKLLSESDKKKETELLLEEYLKTKPEKKPYYIENLLDLDINELKELLQHLETIELKQ